MDTSALIQVDEPLTADLKTAHQKKHLITGIVLGTFVGGSTVES
jgi:hypothetical protein